MIDLAKQNENECYRNAIVAIRGLGRGRLADVNDFVSKRIKLVDAKNSGCKSCSDKIKRAEDFANRKK